MRANVTRAAEGFDRRSFTVAEILRMQDAGIISEDENFELIEGEIAIEAALTSLPYDRGLKARLHARHRFRELWVVDAARRATFIHQGPENAGWRSIAERGPEEALTTEALPGFSIRLGAV